MYASERIFTFTSSASKDVSSHKKERLTSEPLLAKLQWQQGILPTFTHSGMNLSKPAAGSPTKLPEESSEPFSDGEFIKECLVDFTALIWDGAPSQVNRNKAEIWSFTKVKQTGLTFSLWLLVRAAVWQPLTVQTSQGGKSHFWSSCRIKSPQLRLVFLHIIINQEVLWKSVQRMNRAGDVVNES